MKEKSGVEKQEKPRMNLLTNFDDTLQAMSEIEGYEWMENELKIIEKKKANEKIKIQDWQSISAALEYLENRRKDIEEETDPEEKKYLQDNLKNKIFVVYGDGGWNRWFVDGMGNVAYSKYYAPKYPETTRKELLEKISGLGFELVF